MHLRDQRLVEPGLQRCDLARCKRRPEIRSRGVGRRHLPRAGAAGGIGAVDGRNHDLKSHWGGSPRAGRRVSAARDPIVGVVEASVRHGRRGVDHVTIATPATRCQEGSHVGLEAHHRGQIAAGRRRRTSRATGGSIRTTGAGSAATGTTTPASPRHPTCSRRAPGSGRSARGRRPTGGVASCSDGVARASSTRGIARAPGCL